jgi:2'-5' RNA ligase
LPEGFSLFYIAVVCPEPIEQKVAGFKEFMNENYGCRAAQKSPAHLTIIPPFRAEDELMPTLADFVHTFNVGVVPFDVQLNGYGQFGERVLYVHVPDSDSLNQLEKECMTEFESKFPSIIFGMKPEFNPHVTIATRDIPEGKLTEAKTYFEQNHPISESFTVSALKLLRLDKGWWNIID